MSGSSRARVERLEWRAGSGKASWKAYEAASGRLSWRGRYEIRGMLARVRGEEPPPPTRPEGYTPEMEARDEETVRRWQHAHGVVYNAESGRRAVLDLLARSRRSRERSENY